MSVSHSHGYDYVYVSCGICSIRRNYTPDVVGACLRIIDTYYGRGTDVFVEDSDLMEHVMMLVLASSFKGLGYSRNLLFLLSVNHGTALAERSRCPPPVLLGDGSIEQAMIRGPYNAHLNEESGMPLRGKGGEVERLRSVL